jgi:hypothetical protein
VNEEQTTACNCIRCTFARNKTLKPASTKAANEEESLLNKICDEIEAECFGAPNDYNREKMKERLLRHIVS